MEKVTEQKGIHKDLDQKSVHELLTIINEEDKLVAEAVSKQLHAISHFIEIVISKLSKGGRLIYFGSGTSGRLGILDASECPPTFGVSADLVLGLIAGGDQAIRNAVEMAEDDKELAIKDFQSYQVNSQDVVLGISASGTAPYVIGGLAYCKKAGIYCAALSSNPNSEIGNIADHKIEIVVGPEVLQGSTRMKSGTAQKMVLNMISTATMVGLGHVKDNMMIDMKLSNQKLKERARKMLMEITGVDETEASSLLAEFGSVRKAIEFVETRRK